jgi:sugar phosphate isomerase/epimerase
MDAPQAHYSVIREQKTEILNALKRNGMGLVCHLPTFVHIADLTESIRAASVEEMRGSLEVCAEMGVEKAVLHPGHIKGMGVFAAETALAFAYESLALIAEKAGAVGVALCVENMPSNCHAFVEPDDFNPLFKRFPAFRMTLDVGHANIDDKTGGRPTAFIHRFGDRIGHLHFSDNKGKRDDHIRLGKGRVDLKGIGRALKKIGYDGTATLEIFSDKVADLTKSLACLKDIMGSAERILP